MTVAQATHSESALMPDAPPSAVVLPYRVEVIGRAGSAVVSEVATEAALASRLQAISRLYPRGQTVRAWSYGIELTESERAALAKLLPDAATTGKR